MNKTHVVYLTNVPAPYRERMHELLEEENDYKYSVIYCTKLEPNRTWKLEYGNYPKYFLSEASRTFKHNNLNVWKLLKSLNPDVLIITGFNPTMLYGFIWSLLNNKRFLVSLDGTYDSEKEYSLLHKLVRKIVFRFTDAFLGPSNGSSQLFRSYGVKPSAIFKSSLCVDNSKFEVSDIREREFDIMFSGQMIARKMPHFFVDVAIKLKAKYPSLRILMVGDGPQKEEILSKLTDNKISFLFTGFLDQQSLFPYYSKSKLFLFPTLHDPWGIVANEACASGTPVITCSNAGAADDLVLNNINGYILPLEVDIWVENILKLLENEDLLETFSSNAVKMVQPYNHVQAAQGIISAVEYAV